MSEVEAAAPTAKPAESTSTGWMSKFAGLEEAVSSGPLVEAGTEDLGIDDINAAVEAPLTDVPLDEEFWGSNKAESAKAAVPAETQITYKANGKEIKLSLEEAQKKLSLMDGEAKAFEKLGNVTKRMKELEAKLAKVSELEKKASLIDKLEEIKHDPKALMQLITGQDYDEFLKQQIDRRKIYETGSDLERENLDRADRLAKLERQLAAKEERDKQELEERSKFQAQSEKENLKGLMQAEFFKHQFALDSEVDSNDLNEMLWQQSQRQMSRYVNKYKEHPQFEQLVPKMAAKSFEDVAGKLKRLTTQQVQAKVDEAIAKKKANASAQAQVAAGRKMNEIDPAQFKGKGIREIANMIVGRKAF